MPDPLQGTETILPDRYNGFLPREGPPDVGRRPQHLPAGLDKKATLYLYCYNPTCHLAAEAAVQLTSQGYKLIEVEGGWSTWLANGYATEVTAKSA